MTRAPGARVAAAIEIGGWSGEENLLARDSDCAVRNRIEASHSSARARGRTGTRDQLTAVSDDECGGCGGHSGHGGSIARSFSDTSAAFVPATLTILSRARSPDAIEISRRARPRRAASIAMRASFAAPSTGAAASLTSNASPRVPATRVLPARGTTLIRKLTPAGVSARGITWYARSRSRSCPDPARIRARGTAPGSSSRACPPRLAGEAAAH